MRRLTTAALLLVVATCLVPASDAHGADDHEPGPWEEVVFLPESGLSVLLERDPRGVLLERGEYLDLYRRARAAGLTRSGDLTGVATGVLRCDVEGTVEGDTATLRVRLSIATRGAGRVVVPLPLGGSVVAARLDGEPATLGTRDGKLALVVPDEGLHEAVIDVLTPAHRDMGQRQVILPLPPAVASRWSLTIPGRVTAHAEGALFRSERLSSPDRTRLVAFGAGDALRASWREGDEGTDLPPLVRATVHTLAEVGARALDVTTLVRIDCARAPRDSFAVRLPDDLTVLGVDGDGASLGPASDGTRTLRFTEPFTGSRTVLIRSSRTLDGPGVAALPVADVPDATTVARLLGVRFTDGLRGFVEPGPGALQLDPTLSSQGAVNALLRVDADARPEVRTERPVGRLRAEVRALLDLADDGPWLTVSILYTPRGDRLYGVDPLLPDGFLPESVEVVPPHDVLRGTTPDGRLSLVFPGSIADGAAVTVTVRGRWPVPGWATDAWATGDAGRDAPLPRLDAGTAAEAAGFIGVAVPPGTEVRDEDSAGLVPAAVSELRERAAYSAEGLTLGWRFRGSAPGGRLRVTRPEASITATTALLIVPAEDHVSLVGTVGLTVQRGGVREVRLTVTPPLGDLLRIEGPDVAEKRREEVDGVETWVVRFTRAIRSWGTLRLNAELPNPDGLAVVPVVAVQDAARAELEVGVAAAGELDVETEASGLREADQAELLPLLASHPGGLLRAWRAERDVTPTLAVRATRLPPSPLPATFADSVVLRSVIGMDGIVRTRLDARIRNIDRQALDVVLPEGARLSTARVAGKAVRPVRDAAGVLLVPIVPSPTPFDVVLVYEEPAASSASDATLAAPDLGIPGNRAVWTVHLPEGSRPIAADGDFAAPAARPGDPLLLRWLGSSSMIRAIEKRAGAAQADGAQLQAQRDAQAARPRAAPAPVADAAPGEAEMDEEVPPASREASDLGPPTTGGGGIGGPVAASKRIAARATERGLFGMDIHLLAAGPAVTATRLGPTGTVHVRWRSDAGRRTFAILIGVLAFLAGLIMRRRGFGALSWTVLTLGAVTALPIALAVTDTSAWDAAATGTLCFAAVALLGRLARVLTRRPRLPRFLHRRGSAASVAALVLLAFAATSARADDRPAAPAPQDTGARVYVPYDPKHPDALRTPERVFLPYARYRELWNGAHPEERIDATLAPLIVGATYAGRIEGRALILDVEYEIDPADGGVVALPPGAAVDELLLDGEPVAATTSAPGGATLVHVPRATADSARRALTATLRWPISGNGPGGNVRTPLPRVPRAELTLDVPLADAVMGITARGGHESTPTDDGTRLTAALGPVDYLEFFWRPRGADVAGGRTRFEVDTEAAVAIGPDAVEWRADMIVRVLSGELLELDAGLPAGLQLTAVEGAAVASWTVENGTALRLRLLGVPGETPIVLRGVLLRGDRAAAIDIPDVVFPDASADRLRVVVSADGRRVIPVRREGMERTDAAAGAAPGALAFRRVRKPGRLSVRAEPLPGGLAVASRHHLHLGPERSLVRTELDLTPGPDGLHEAEIPLPAGWTLDDDSGAHVFAMDGGLRLVFPGASGTARHVALRLRGPAAGEGPFPVPVLRVAGAERESADVLVSTAPGFAATIASVENAEALPAEQLAAWPVIGDAEVRALAWRTARGAPRISVRREALRTTLRPTVVADLTVLDDRVIVDALVHWEIRGGPAHVFRVDAPAGVDDAWVLGEGLREVRREDVDGRQRLTVTLQAATTGAVAFRVLYDLPVSTDGALDVVGPEPVDGDGARAFLLLRAMGESEVRLGASPTLERCDVSDLPLIPEGLDPLRVLQFLRARGTAWVLPLELAAHELGELPEARVALVEATTVADRDGSTRTRMELRLFNRARAFLPVRLPAGAVLESVVVAGAPVRPVVRAAEAGVVQVPVRVQSLGEESQVVALTFRMAPTVPGGRFDELEPVLAEFPGVPVDATTWRVVLPPDREYAFSGNLDPVEEVEVAIARAEAYASDVARLRNVFEKGSRQQQFVAAQNIQLQSRGLQETLDSARAGLDRLERAAAEGRIDQGRLRESRRKADELAKNIADVLEQVADAETPELAAQSEGGAYRGPAGEVLGETAQRDDTKQQEVRFSTKEGQAGKKWASNTAGGEPPPGQTAVQTRSGAMQAGPSGDVQLEAAAEKLAATAAFQDAFGLRRYAADAPVRGQDQGGGGAEARPFDDRRGDADVVTADALGGPSIGSGGGRPDHGGRGAGYYGFGGGAGAGGGRRAVAQGVSGLISLEPQLVTDGRTYAFRKLESNAELVVTTRARGMGRRLAALGLFAVLALVVLALRRRLARRNR